MGDHFIFSNSFLELIISVLVKGRHEDSGEDPWSWAHVTSTLTIGLVQPTLIISMLILHDKSSQHLD